MRGPGEVAALFRIPCFHVARHAKIPLLLQLIQSFASTDPLKRTVTHTRSLPDSVRVVVETHPFIDHLFRFMPERQNPIASSPAKSSTPLVGSGTALLTAMASLPTTAPLPLPDTPKFALHKS